jgi:hypothetical protein
MTRTLTDYEQDIIDYLQTISCGFLTTREIFAGIHLFEGDKKDIDKLSKCLWHLENDDKLLSSAPIPNDKHNRKMYGLKTMTQDNLLEPVDDPVFYRESLIQEKHGLHLTLDVIRDLLIDLEKFVKIDDVQAKIERIKSIADLLNDDNYKFLNSIADDLERFK